MADLNLFKLIETSSADLVTARVPGQYIVQDDGQMFYDNTLGNRIKLSPDLSNFLTKTFSNSVVTNVVFSQNEVDETAVDLTVTTLNPNTNEESTNVYTFKFDDGSITVNENGELSFKLNVVDEATEGDTTAISSNAVALIKNNLEQLISDNAKLAIPTIKVIAVASDSNDETALGSWANEDVAGVPAKTGDMAILTHAIGSTGKLSRTAYVYNIDHWEAMDGNYDASNVYLGTDILLAGNYTAVGNVSKGTTAATKDAGWAGLSMADIFTNIFTQTLNPSKPAAPSVSMSLTNAGAVEVGASITPSFKVTFDPKTYAYGSAKDNGKAGGSTYATPSTVTLTTSAGETLEGTMTTGDSWDGKSVTLTLTGAEIKVTTGTSYNGTKVTCDYGDGVIPWTNTKKEYNASQVKGSKASSTTATSKITGYYAKYWGYTTDSNLIADPANLKVSDISKLTVPSGSATKVKNIPTSVKNSGMRQIFFVVPKGSVSSVDVIASTTIPFGTAAKGATLTLTDASGVDTYECDVWYISQPSAGADNETYTLTLA